MSTRKVAAVAALAVGLCFPVSGEAAPVLFAAAGPNSVSIQATVDLFRATLGDPNNANAAGPLASGRREINWDGGGATTTAVAGSVFTGFQNTRGGLFTTAGTGFAQAVLSETTAADQTLSELLGNATYATEFSTFSPRRIFTPLGSNVTDSTFFIPGSLDPAGVTAFGAVFTDVDLFGPTKIDFYGVGDQLLLSQTVLASPGTGGLSFLGVQFTGGEIITRARITTGTGALGPNDNPAGGVDMVAMDDFIYSEPRSVPEPATLLLFGVAALTLARTRQIR